MMGVTWQAAQVSKACPATAGNVEGKNAHQISRFFPFVYVASSPALAPGASVVFRLFLGKHGRATGTVVLLTEEMCMLCYVARVTASQIGDK